MFSVENKNIEREFEFRNPVRISKVETFFSKVDIQIGLMMLLRLKKQKILFGGRM